MAQPFPMKWSARVGHPQMSMTSLLTPAGQPTDCFGRPRHRYLMSLTTSSIERTVLAPMHNGPPRFSGFPHTNWFSIKDDLWANGYLARKNITYL